MNEENYRKGDPWARLRKVRSRINFWAWESINEIHWGGTELQKRVRGEETWERVNEVRRSKKTKSPYTSQFSQRGQELKKRGTKNKPKYSRPRIKETLGGNLKKEMPVRVRTTTLREHGQRLRGERLNGVANRPVPGGSKKG